MAAIVAASSSPIDSFWSPIIAGVALYVREWWLVSFLKSCQRWQISPFFTGVRKEQLFNNQKLLLSLKNNRFNQRKQGARPGDSANRFWLVRVVTKQILVSKSCDKTDSG
jgi:hypothetical protein